MLRILYTSPNRKVFRLRLNPRLSRRREIIFRDSKALSAGPRRRLLAEQRASGLERRGYGSHRMARGYKGRRGCDCEWHVCKWKGKKKCCRDESQKRERRHSSLRSAFSRPGSADFGGEIDRRRGMRHELYRHEIIGINCNTVFRGFEIYMLCIAGLHDPLYTASPKAQAS